MPIKKTMTGKDVELWGRMAIELKLAKNEIELANLLGVTRQTLYNMRKDGADRRTDFACRAILSGSDLWSEYVKKSLQKPKS
jgi:hypothetical protein